MKTHLVLGGPGTGKTSRLLEIMAEELKRGTRPQDMAFVSFTRKAIDEARARAKRLFGFVNRELPYFRTLHSLCYFALGLDRTFVLTKTHLNEIAALLNTKISGSVSPDEATDREGDRMLFLDHLARSTLRTLAETWSDGPGDDVPWLRQQQFSDTLREFKTRRGLVDFPDMLLDFVTSGCGPIPVRVAIIDEAQDLSLAQWAVIESAFSECERVYVAGDDDQAIYTWSGADVQRFLSVDADTSETLPRSWRLPSTVFAYADSLVKGIATRYEKHWLPCEREGEVVVGEEPSALDLSRGEWLLLARNRWFLKRFETECVRQGVTYTTRFGSSVDRDDVEAIRGYEEARNDRRDPSEREMDLVADRLDLSSPPSTPGEFRKLLVSMARGIWHDAFTGMSLRRRAYYLTVLRAGGKLTRPPRVHVDTVHSVKGGEADNVALAPDMTRLTEETQERDPDGELRVFYVGATRARERLHVLSPQTPRFFARYRGNL